MKKNFVLVIALLLCVLFVSNSVAGEIGYVVLYSDGRPVTVLIVDGSEVSVSINSSSTLDDAWSLYRNISDRAGYHSPERTWDFYLLYAVVSMIEEAILSLNPETSWNTPDGHTRKTNMDYIYYDEPVAIKDGEVVFLD